MNLKEKIKRKLMYHQFNLDYPQHLELKNQTNNLINFIMNDFLIHYEEDFKDKYVVYEYQDDIYSVVGYHILKHIQAIVPFNLLIFSKKFFNHYKIKEQFINEKKLKKLENKIIFVSAYNPIYKVLKNKKVFKKFDKQYNIIESFTPEEIIMVSLFYKINISKEDRKLFLDTTFKQFRAFANGLVDSIDKINILSYDICHIIVVKLTGNFQKDKDKLDRIIKTDGLIFYEVENPDCETFKSGFEFYLKNKANIPDEKYFNINEFEIVENLKLNGFNVEVVE